jgi:hypothetical protein
MKPSLLRIVLCCLPACPAFAQYTSTYSLFNPVPKGELREFSIDRPDITESPITVDPGHFQFEGDLYKWTDAGDLQLINLMSGLYKMGLTTNWDIHIGIEAYNIYQDSDGKESDKGYGNTFIRLKRNLWGNDGTNKTALGMIPFVVLPTSPVDRDVVFGVGFPFSCSISDNLGWGAQSQFDFLPTDDSYKLSYFQTVVLGGQLVGPMDFYVEALALFFEGSSVFTANGGVIYNTSPNVKIDLATNIGLTDESPSRVYLGLSFRI